LHQFQESAVKNISYHVGGFTVVETAAFNINILFLPVEWVSKRGKSVFPVGTAAMLISFLIGYREKQTGEICFPIGGTIGKAAL
jgi:hypothetical protein